MAKVASINKYNLKIARENTGFSTVQASKSLTTSKKDIVALWESGKDLPTWAQVRKIAKKYNVQDLILFSSKKIKKQKTIPDFRVGVDETEKNKVKKLINLVLDRQEWLEDTLKKKGYSKNKLLGSGKNIDSPVKLAEHISKILEVDIEEIKKISGVDSRKKALKYLIRKTENQNIFVGKTISYHNIQVENMRGMFISNDYCPFIVLNRKDSVSAQIFSFVHELAHFFRKSESISNSIDFRSSNKNVNSEEVFCNKVAANFLLPKKDFVESSYNYDGIKVISSKYKVSTLFVFYRLKELNKINKGIFKTLENQIKEDTKRGILASKKKKAEQEGGNYYNNMMDSNGELFNKIVANSYLEKKINDIEASNLLKFSPEIYG